MRHKPFVARRGDHEMQMRWPPGMAVKSSEHLSHRAIVRNRIGLCDDRAEVKTAVSEAVQYASCAMRVVADVTGYMTWNYASGLALYWTIGNLISIAQQSVMNRTSLGREMREIAAKRARRRTGTPTTISGKR